MDETLSEKVDRLVQMAKDLYNKSAKENHLDIAEATDIIAELSQIDSKALVKMERLMYRVRRYARTMYQVARKATGATGPITVDDLED